MKSLSPIEKLKAERQKRLERSTKEERIAQATKLVEELEQFGKNNFPLAPSRWEQSEWGDDD